MGGGVEGGEALIDAHGIIGAEHGHGRAEMHPLRPSGNCSEDDLRCRDSKVSAVMFANPKKVDTDRIRQLALGYNVTDDLRVW